MKLGHDANEQRAEIVVIGLTVSSDGKILVDANDTLAGYLAAKLKAGANIALVIENVGGNEQLRVDIGTAIATKAYADAGDAATLASADANADAGDATTLTAAGVAANAALNGRVPAGAKGDTLIHNGTLYKPTNFGTADINGNVNQAPAVADGHTFYVDATALTADRTIMPSVTGAAEREGITFKVNVATSGTGKKYSLVADVTLALSQKMMVECIFRSGAWQIGEWKPYTD